MKKHKKNTIILNLTGLRCPEPIMMVRKTIRNIKNNEKILIFSDDPTTIRDIPNFCYFTKHRLLEQDTKQVPYQYLLKKGL